MRAFASNTPTAYLALATLLMSCGDEASDDPCARDKGRAEDPICLQTERTWQWVEFPDAFCRDGSRASIAISKVSESKNLLIYFEGGGACFDAESCLINPGNTSLFPRGAIDRGIFNRAQTENPVRDWNYVYIPYCTGDVHAGTNPEGMIDGLGTPQKFVGYTNVSVFLKRLAPTFADAERVLISGSSAGGFGASANVPQIRRAFPDAVGSLINDSGPPMSSTYISECLQRAWREAWGLEGSMLAECGEACTNENDFTMDFALHLADVYGDEMAGLIESREDAIIRSFFGAGANDCKGSLLGGSPGIEGEAFSEGLRELDEAFSKYENFGTFIPEGSTHTYLMTDAMYRAEIEGTKLTDWLRDIVEGKRAARLGL